MYVYSLVCLKVALENVHMSQGHLIKLFNLLCVLMLIIILLKIVSIFQTCIMVTCSLI